MTGSLYLQFLQEEETSWIETEMGLAVNGTVLQVGVVPGKMEEDRTASLKKLAEEMDMTVEEIETKLGAAWVTDDVFVPLKSMAKGDGEGTATVGDQRGYVI